ncbi:MAG TPA: MFS transporter [Acetobacteraceae bacterium]|nr:MFS transporter [Acetobacteraceae bacterium]
MSAAGEAATPGERGAAPSRRAAFAWAFYDWANSAFPTVVSTFVIATYFADAIAPTPAEGQAQWAFMQSLAGVAIAILSPVLGAVADAGGRRRLMLALCTVGVSVTTAGLWWAEPNPSFAFWALLCVGLGTVAFEVGNVFYNSMLLQVATPDRYGRLSGLAWGLGYAGGLTCLTVALFLFVWPNPSPLGLDRAQAEHVRAVALLVAAWVLVFGWPVLLALPDPPGALRPPLRQAARRGLVEVVALIRTLSWRTPLARFMAARLFYTDGLNTLFILGGIYAAGVFGFTYEETLLFGIAINVTAGLGAAAFGLVEDRIGSRRTVVIALGAIMAIGIGLLVAEGKPAFWILALLIGVFFGPAQAASRTLMAKMVPAGEASAHFGLFALSGRVTGFLGPAVLGAVTAATSSQRAGMATVVVFLGIGLALLLTVREPPRAA